MKKFVISMLIVTMVLSFVPITQPVAQASEYRFLSSSEMQVLKGTGGDSGGTTEPEPEPAYSTYWRQAGTGYRTDYGTVQLVAYPTNQSNTMSFHYYKEHSVAVTTGSSLSGGVNALDLFNLGYSYNNTTQTTTTRIVDEVMPPRTAFKLYMKQIIDVNFYKAEYVKDYADSDRIEVLKTETAERKYYNGNFKETMIWGKVNPDGTISWNL